MALLAEFSRWMNFAGHRCPKEVRRRLGPRAKFWWNSSRVGSVAERASWYSSGWCSIRSSRLCPSATAPSPLTRDASHASPPADQCRGDGISGTSQRCPSISKTVIMANEPRRVCLDAIQVSGGRLREQIGDGTAQGGRWSVGIESGNAPDAYKTVECAIHIRLWREAESLRAGDTPGKELVWMGDPL
jgi:hypothetical protein